MSQVWGKLKRKSGNELAWPRTQRPLGGPRTAPRVDLGGLKGQQGRSMRVWKVKRVEGYRGCSQDNVLVSSVLWLLSRGQQVPGGTKAICRLNQLQGHGFCCSKVLPLITVLPRFLGDN